MDLVNEEHVAFLEIGEQRREIARLGDDGAEVALKLTPSSRDMICANVVFPRPGRAGEEHVVQRLAARLAASMKTRRFCLPWTGRRNSSSRCGLRCVSMASQGSSRGR